MKQNEIWLIILIQLTLYSCFYKSIDPPFSDEVYLNIKETKIVLGYSTNEYIKTALGEPDDIEDIKYGGEDFYWENMLGYSYFEENLKLIFSIEKNKLIQIIFTPNNNEKFECFGNINELSNKNEILNIFQNRKYEYTMSPRGTIWLNFYSNKELNLSVLCGFQFNENDTIFALNFMVDSPW
jgi:hypothetical protein